MTQTTTQSDDPSREELAGGFVHAGAVFRVGSVVERPAAAHADALHAYLLALRAHGFEAGPVPVGPVEDGRERLTFVEGEVPLPPFPDEAMTSEVLDSVGRLLRRLHDASVEVAVDPGAEWPRDLADPEGGTLLCHNDLCPENVVLRDGRAAGVIDFDLAAPGRPLWDLAMTARYWVPLIAPESRAASYPPGLDVPVRLRILADGYGLDGAGRAALPEVIEQVTERCRAFVVTRVEAGDPVYERAWAERGGRERWDRLQAWLAESRDVFAAALSRPTAEPARGEASEHTTARVQAED
ncbi:phosphotransferase [Streptomyces sp. NPDC050418]|uniref:phosphotransferase n=1 Tax=Streptomyces sp. NPDC050418 TaxID=3365612 RepID=UPI003794C02E